MQSESSGSGADLLPYPVCLQRGWLIIYCIEPEQSNPLHKHSGSDEICYFVQGTGDVISGSEIAAIEPRASVCIPKDVGHEIINTGTDRMIVVWAQSPLPCAHEKVLNPLSEFRRIELNR